MEDTAFLQVITLGDMSTLICRVCLDAMLSFTYSEINSLIHGNRSVCPDLQTESPCRLAKDT